MHNYIVYPMSSEDLPETQRADGGMITNEPSGYTSINIENLPEFQALKAEVQELRAEVEQLKNLLRDLACKKLHGAGYYDEV